MEAEKNLEKPAPVMELEPVEVMVVDPEIVKFDQSFYFIAQPDQTTGKFTLSIPYDSVKAVLGSGLLKENSKIVKFTIPL